MDEFGKTASASAGSKEKISSELTPSEATPMELDPQLLLKCVHCGLCTSACPTYTELGDENDGPRGRIYLMRLITAGQARLTGRIRRHLDLCLDCRACQSACPSGVQYGQIIEPFRMRMHRSDDGLAKKLDWFRQLILLRVFPYRGRVRLAMAPLRLLQRLGIYQLAERLGLWRLVPGRLGRMLRLVPPLGPAAPKLPEFLPAVGRRRARIAFFVGCVADAMLRHIHWATLRVLQQNGCDVLIPPGQGCCGAIHFHAGDDEGARQMADRNVEAFNLQQLDAVVVNHAGCGAMMKEYGLHWHDAGQPARQELAEKIVDVNEFLDRLGLVPPLGRIDLVATYHDACHLAHAQGIVDPPRRLLAAIAGLELRPLPETGICCGSAGTYNLTEPEMADRLVQRKVDNVVRTGAQVVLASNAGCLMQIQAELRRRRLPIVAMHPMELLDLSYREQQPKLPQVGAARRSVGSNGRES